MKLVGIILVFAAFTVTGFVMGRKYTSLLDGIERAEEFVEELITGIADERQTILEILENIHRNDEATAAFIQILKNTSKGKMICFKHNYAVESGFCIDDYSNKLVEKAFNIFGKTTAHEQTACLKRIRAMLAKRYDELSDSVTQKAKLSRSFGVLTGFAVAIILL